MTATRFCLAHRASAARWEPADAPALKAVIDGSRVELQRWMRGQSEP
jgi:hypothetical protein